MLGSVVGFGLLFIVRLGLWLVAYNLWVNRAEILFPALWWLSLITLALFNFYQGSNTILLINRLLWLYVLFGIALYNYKKRFSKGFFLTAFGGLLNCLVTFANGMKMPVADRESFDTAQYVAMTDETRLNFLGDWIQIPYLPEGPIMSMGDILIIVGLYTIVFMFSRKNM